MGPQTWGRPEAPHALEIDNLHRPTNVMKHAPTEARPRVHSSVLHIPVGSACTCQRLERRMKIYNKPCSRFGALCYTHIASFSHLTWKLISIERYEIICFWVPADQLRPSRPLFVYFLASPCCWDGRTPQPSWQSLQHHPQHPIFQSLHPTPLPWVRDAHVPAQAATTVSRRFHVACNLGLNRPPLFSMSPPSIRPSSACNPQRGGVSRFFSHRQWLRLVHPSRRRCGPCMQRSLWPTRNSSTASL